MKASIVNTIITKDLAKIDCIMLTSNQMHYIDRMYNPKVDVSNEILIYQDKRNSQYYIVDCNDINNIIYKKPEINSDQYKPSII